MLRMDTVESDGAAFYCFFREWDSKIEPNVQPTMRKVQ